MAKLVSKLKDAAGYLWPEAAEANAASLAAQVATHPNDCNCIACKALDDAVWSEMCDSGGSIKAPVGFTTYGGTTTVYKKCEHEGDKPQFSVMLPGNTKITLAGGSGKDVEETDETTLIIDLAGEVPKFQPWIKSGPKHFNALELANPYKAPVLRLDWYDRSAPDVPHSWWKQFLVLIEKHHAPGHVIVACFGGHGRTGTCIACILLTADETLSVAKAIEMVRNAHCKKAIESKAQYEYLKKFRPDEKPSEEFEKEFYPPATPSPAVVTKKHKNFNMKAKKGEATKDGTDYKHMAVCENDNCPGCNLLKPPTLTQPQASGKKERKFVSNAHLASCKNMKCFGCLPLSQ